MRHMMSVFLEGTLDDELGYSKYTYLNKDTENSYNGHFRNAVTQDSDIEKNGMTIL